MELGENETVAVDLFSELEGVNAWLLRNISTVANVRITVDIFRLPDSLRNSPDRVKQLDYVFNKLQGKGCGASLKIKSFPPAVSSLARCVGAPTPLSRALPTTRGGPPFLLLSLDTPLPLSQ